MNNLGLILLGVSLTSFFTAFSGSSITIALPAIGGDLGLSAVQLSWIPIAYILANAALLLPMGRAADIFGRKRFMTLGVAVYAVTSLLAAFSRSGPFLVAARALQGLGGALMFSTAGAIIVASFPRERRGHAIGINSAAVYAGLSSGPVLGGLLVRTLGWNSIFWVTSVLAVPVLFLLRRRLPADEVGGEDRYDRIGTLIYGPSIVFLVIGLSSILETSGRTLSALGLAGLGAFVLVERKVSNPLVDISLFTGNRVFAFSNLSAMIHYGATFSISFFMSIYLQTVKGLSPDKAGLILLTQPFVQALFSPLSGRLSDRIEARFLSSAGLALSAVGLLLLSTFGAATGVVPIVAVLAVVGLGYALFISPNTNAIMSSVGRSTYGLAASMVSTMRLLGQMLSMSAAAVLLAVFVGDAGVSAAASVGIVRAMSSAFGGAAVLCALGILLSWARGGTPPDSPPAD
jgi:EmrB/QacA subfamily drug resistance transporter